MERNIVTKDEEKAEVMSSLPQSLAERLLSSGQPAELGYREQNRPPVAQEDLLYRGTA